MKSVNKKAVLNKIRLHGPISRANIAKETGLTPPTVTNIVKELIEEFFVKESHLGESSGGRKPTLLHLNEDGYYVIGVDAGSNTIEAAVCNIYGHALLRSENKIPKTIDSEPFLNIMIQTIRTLLEDETVQPDKIIGIGVAMHGVMNIEEGISYYSSNSGLKNVPVKSELEKEFGYEVKLENNSRALALGEFWFGGFEHVNRFCAINVGRGVGSGLVVNGKLIHGPQYVAGEIGHTVISVGGDLCTCGNRGCLETFVSGGSIVKRAKEQINHAPNSLTAEDVYHYAVEGNEDYIRVLEETGYYLSIGLLNLINTENPDTIVLGGGVMRSAEFLMPILLKNIREKALTHKLRDEVNILVGKLDDDATLLGAAALLFNEYF
ncbi:ROK family transcriptional regulator [Atopostipes suicloacalis]|nr:ROK family transcriptional regulator [Atopostipes suicloacalis]